MSKTKLTILEIVLSKDECLTGKIGLAFYAIRTILASKDKELVTSSYDDRVMIESPIGGMSKMISDKELRIRQVLAGKEPYESMLPELGDALLSIDHMFVPDYRKPLFTDLFTDYNSQEPPLELNTTLTFDPVWNNLLQRIKQKAGEMI